MPSGKYGLRIWGSKRTRYFKTLKQRQKVTRQLKNKVTYTTFTVKNKK